MAFSLPILTRCRSGGVSVVLAVVVVMCVCVSDVCVCVCVCVCVRVCVCVWTYVWTCVSECVCMLGEYINKLNVRVMITIAPVMVHFRENGLFTAHFNALSFWWCQCSVRKVPR
eukprot:TRINITY_DN60317_c0_g1_i3.p1 TRINITY_DN60317_c0_g1~~TRINITY_DN60317_c0_g1_i3.p1  ORF type:complete len:114 (+),score=21.42 TRINITY_DN60317_c0_g1_i3:75-416(+)